MVISAIKVVRSDAFDVSQAIVRELKDLTLVGVTYWNHDASIDRLSQALATIDPQVDYLAYCNSTPHSLGDFRVTGARYHSSAGRMESFLQDS